MTLTEEKARERYDDPQKCPCCGGWYSPHSPPVCFACAVGLDDAKGHHPDGVGP